jgi:hypothetical protein
MNSAMSADKKLYGLDHLRALAIILVFYIAMEDYPPTLNGQTQ